MNNHRETMRLLEQARPLELTPTPDPDRRGRDLALAMNQPPTVAGRPAWLVTRRTTLAWSGGGLAAAAVAVVIGLTVAAPPMDHAPTGTSAVSAPALLLAAATQVASGTAGTPGGYWLSTVRSGRQVQVGPPTNRYMLWDEAEVQLWMSTVPGRDQGLVNRPIGATPATPADRDAWRRDGSPTRWISSVTANPGEPPKSAVLYASGQSIQSFVGPTWRWSFVTGGRSFTLAELLALPSDPVALRKILVDSFNELRLPDADGGLDAYLYDAGTQILTRAPATPAIRAAAYRMLAQLPGVRAVGPVTLPGGGRGEATARTREDVEGVHDVILVFDPATGTTLGTEQRMVKAGSLLPWVPTGTVYTYEVVIHAGWTDGTPPPSTFPPHAVPSPTRK